ncbi:MAG: cytochrome c biogenesis protein CcdA [Bacteroidota bacterium]
MYFDKPKHLLSAFLLIAITFVPALVQGQSFGGGESSGSGGTLDKVSVDVISGQDSVTAGSEVQFAIAMDIDEGWHLNAHNPPLDYLIGVELEMATSDQAIISDIQYPEPLQKKFSFAEEILDVYEGTSYVVLKAKSGNNLEEGTHTLEGELTIQACSDEVCLPPNTVELEFPFTVGSEDAPANAELFEELEDDQGTVSQGSANEIASMFSEQGSFWAFLSIFLIGLALNLTPCVYPMISVTVSLFGGTAQKDAVSTGKTFSRALVYVMGIVSMYSVLGVMAAYTGDLFGSWMQSPWVLAGIGILILLLSLSMFGLYELQPPAWMMQKLGKTQQTTGFIGHFLSGLLVGVFAAPCIGPPIIALLAFVGAQGSPLFGFFAFFVMALGLGIPYLFLGTFSGYLNKLPQSGTWMIWVKKLFGIVLVGVALFYLALAFMPAYTMWSVLITLLVGGIYLGFFERSGNEKQTFRWVKYATGIGALIGALLLFQNLQKEGIEWQEYDADLIEQTDQPVILDFYADWCIPCIELERQTYVDDEVIESTDDFLRMKVDLTRYDSERSEELRKQYDIAGVPTVMFLDSDGNEIQDARVIGFLGPEPFLKKVEIAKEEQ